MKIFPVPFALGEIKKNISISTNTTSKLSKEQIIKQAIKFHSDGNIKEATKYYQYVINQGFKDYRVFSNYGAILQGLGKSKEAEIYLRKAIKIKPFFADSLNNLASLLCSNGKLKEAEEYARKAIKLKPNFADAYSNLGGILINLDKNEEAEKSIRKSIRLQPNISGANYNLGTALYNLGHLKEAEIYTRKEIKINPNFALAHLNLGSILIALGNLKEAELSNRKAIQFQPNLDEAHFNLGNTLRDLGKSEEFLLLSKLTLETSSTNQGYKLLTLLQITITYLLKNDFPKMVSHINKIKKLISTGTVNTIKDEKDKKYFLSFFLFITSLYPLLEKKSDNLDLEKIPHIGESHCLSFAHQTLSISSKLRKIQPVLITGGQAWYFSKQGNNQWKDSLKQQLKNHTYSDYVFISFGEIDCKKDENMFNYAIKKNKDILVVCEETIKNYLNYMETTLSPSYSKRYYFGVPAPTKNKEFADILDIKRNEMIKIFNSLLKQEVLSRGSYFLDVYELTSTENGENNNLYMCDKTHLSPKCLSILFENNLYEPNIYSKLTS